MILIDILSGVQQNTFNEKSLIKVRNMVLCLRVSIKVEFYKELMNPRVVQGQNKHNIEN